MSKENKDKEERILSAAQVVFSRYGYARTTMSDAAAAAGVSRPALYLVFPGKDELFSAVIRRMNRIAFEDIHSGLATCETLEEKLRFGLDRWIAQAYDIVFTNPDAKRFVSPFLPGHAGGFRRVSSVSRRFASGSCSGGVSGNNARRLGAGAFFLGAWLQGDCFERHRDAAHDRSASRGCSRGVTSSGVEHEGVKRRCQTASALRPTVCRCSARTSAGTCLRK